MREDKTQIVFYRKSNNSQPLQLVVVNEFTTILSALNICHVMRYKKFID